MSETIEKKSISEEGKPFFSIIVQEGEDGVAQAEVFMQGDKADICALGVSSMTAIVHYLMRETSVSFSRLMKGFYMAMGEIEEVEFEQTDGLKLTIEE